MDKVRLPRQVAEALESARIDYPNEDDFILWKSCQEDGKKNYFKVLQSFTRSRGGAITLARAILNGYEIETEPITVTITPEMQDKLRKMYNDSPRDERVGIRYALTALDLKIHGVNA